MIFRVINLNDSDWDYIIKMAVQHDFHHTSCYHSLELKKSEVASMFVLESGLNFIALPLIISPIFPTSYFDARSVYGYSGPLFSRSVSVEMFNIFKFEFTRYCEMNNIVSVFSRLHPQIDSSIFFENFGTLKYVGKVVFMDLRESPDKQRAHYASSNKNQINKLKRDNFTFEILDISEIKNVEEFIGVYNENMTLVNANQNYYFSLDYINKFLNNHCFDKLLLAVRKDSKICCAGIFTIVDGIMQYHLSGTKNEYRKFRPMKLLLDEARLLANDRNLHTFNLGGGYTANDSLFEFKKSFSNFTTNYYVWNYIVNIEIYKQLVEELTISVNMESDFFPLYRIK
jgi:hypothetical protein